jgi:UDP-N-acetylglucosamine--N-acetylmuramyl-(pentapeptide) pyrophosphoryl-undecaprenol N-acetylglucosamine transferase
MLADKKNLATPVTSSESFKVPPRLLIAASGTGGHLFPAIATAEQLPDYQIEWLGVPNRLEKNLVPDRYPLHTIALEGFQQRFGLGSLRITAQFITSIRTTRKLLKQGNFKGVFTTGGYIAAPAIIAARSLSIPVILHESNALPGKVTRWFSPWCTTVAVGFETAKKYLPRAKTVCTGTPVRSHFLSSQTHDLPIPDDVPLIVVFGGSQGAVAVNKMVREAAPAWFAAGAWVVHITGDRDPDALTLENQQYISLPFYENMAGLLQRANLAISRAGAGSLTELAIAKTPSILIPYPFAAEDHQAFNAKVFAEAGAALVFRQSELTVEVLQNQVLSLLQAPENLEKMAQNAAMLAVPDSAEKLATLVRELVEG